MTEIEKEIDQFFHTWGQNPATARTYKAAYRRFQTRVPSYAWGDKESVVRYRQLLTPALRSVFGVMYEKMYWKCYELGVECVPDTELCWQFTPPFVLTKHIERLVNGTSYAVLSDMRWGDVHEEDENFYLRKWKLTPNMIDALSTIGSYFWGEDTPPKNAPIVALSKKTREVPIDAPGIEAMVKDIYQESVSGVESRYAYAMYPLLVLCNVPVAGILEVFDQLKAIKGKTKYAQRDARLTLKEALEALRCGDIPEFYRLMEHALQGKAERRKPTVEEVVAKKMREKQVQLAAVAPSDDLG